MISDHELATLKAQRDRLAKALADCIKAAGIDIGDCSLEGGPDLLALAMDLEASLIAEPLMTVQLLREAHVAGETFCHHQARAHAQGCPQMEDWDQRRNDTISSLIKRHRTAT